MESKVTAIVSAYFAERYIYNRLVNLNSQEPAPEVIVVAQRGSIEAETAKCVGWGHLIETEDIPTIYAAWNIAIQHASRDYIVNANCDDLFTPGGLAAMQAALDHHPRAALVYTNLMREEPNGMRQVWNRPPGKMADLPHRCFVGPMPMWRRSLHKKYGMFDESFIVAGDYEFWLRLGAGGEHFHYLDKVCGVYRNRPDSLEHRNRAILADENKRAREATWRAQA